MLWWSLYHRQNNQLKFKRLCFRNMKDYEYDNLFCKIPKKKMQKSAKFAMIGEMDFCNFASIFPSLKGWMHHHSNPPCWTFAKSDFAPLWPLAKYWFRKGIVSAVINLPNSKAEETHVRKARKFYNSYIKRNLVSWHNLNERSKAHFLSI